MTVAELIVELLKMPQDTSVSVIGDDCIEVTYDDYTTGAERVHIQPQC